MTGWIATKQDYGQGHDMMNTQSDDLAEFMAENLMPFKPFAYFDKHMDCIRVLIQDVSITEKRLSKYFTVATPNHGAFSGRNVGFTIKGVAHLFNAVGLPLSGVQMLVNILNEIVKAMPHSAVQTVVEEFSEAISENELTVSFEEPEFAMAA